MIEYTCPECGELLESPDTLAGEDDTCPSCGNTVHVPQAEGNIPEADRGNAQDDTIRLQDNATSRSSHALSKVFGGTAIVLMSIICYAGGLALHIWATYLIHKHLGTFWAVLGFFTPPFAELPVLVACFWWGVWFYVLAVACWVASAVGVGLAEEMGTSPKVSVVPLLLVLGLGGSFAYFAIDHATSPQAMTEERVRELDDVAAAICGVLIASTSGDPLDAANLPDAKASLRKTLRRYDERSLRIVRDKVDCYLRFTAYVMDDLTAHIAGRNRSTPFALSERTRGAVASLPTAVRAAAGPEQIGLLEKQVSEAFRNQQGDLRSDWRELMATFQDAQWRIHAQVYEDLFGSPPPSLAELTRK